eukprot:CAMPEP_0168326588 /NCGR_PEP_ID=MMETSP0213-20121227/5391_1 /TAXON_ID=151035 /ORGANISM="Euplotes harpa, Strain FSP1.4" /LENGTH=124 /DNA_ID=CAMNT_0008329329 /DNA_START=128 /DNA_END=502 /DNA_ORIENTATION=+
MMRHESERARFQIRVSREFEKLRPVLLVELAVKSVAFLINEPDCLPLIVRGDVFELVHHGDLLRSHEKSEGFNLRLFVLYNSGRRSRPPVLGDSHEGSSITFQRACSAPLKNLKQRQIEPLCDL